MDRGGQDPDAQIPRAEGRRGRLTDMENVLVSGAVEQDGAHARNGITEGMGTYSPARYRSRSGRTDPPPAKWVTRSVRVVRLKVGWSFV